MTKKTALTKQHKKAVNQEETTAFYKNLIFFSFVYLCFQYKYMDIMRKGMIIYGGIGLYYWFREWKEKKK